MDTRLWMNYQLSLDQVEKSPERQENYNLDNELEEIKKFLKKM